MRRIVLAYIPVLHRGYLDLVWQQESDLVGIVGDSVLAGFPEFDYINRKDRIRAVPQETMAACLRTLGVAVEVLEEEDIMFLDSADVEVIMPQEDISRHITTTYLQKARVTLLPIFLRWHRDNVTENMAVEHHRAVSATAFDREMMGEAARLSRQSSDWWRQIGAIVVKNGEVLLTAWNRHTPDQQMPYVFGDPRSIFTRGVNLEITTADHAEKVVVSEAAKRGIALEGSWLYVTDFPCRWCASSVARAGFTRCYFARGYANLDGVEVLQSAGIELIFVEPTHG